MKPNNFEVGGQLTFQNGGEAACVPPEVGAEISEVYDLVVFGPHLSFFRSADHH
jgi:hypothetical protein